MKQNLTKNTKTQTCAEFYFSQISCLALFPPFPSHIIFGDGESKVIMMVVMTMIIDRGYHDGDHAHDMDGGEDDNDGEISYSSDEPPRPDRGFNSPFDAKHSCRHWKVKTILTISQLLSSS